MQSFRNHGRYLAMSAAVLLSGLAIAGTIWQNSERDEDRREARTEQAEQFCMAIPAAAAAGAQALVDVLVLDARADGDSEAEIQHTIQLGRAYVARAEINARATLPACQEGVEVK